MSFNIVTAESPIRYIESSMDEMYGDDWNTDDLASLLDLNLDEATNLLEGYLEVDEKIATKLAEVFSGPKEFWLEKEKAYREDYRKQRLYNFMDRRIPTEETVSLPDILKTMRLDNLIKVEQVSDGYHSFSDLYKHRNTLVLALLSYVVQDENFKVYKSWRQSDGQEYKGWFLALIERQEDKAQISYHLPDYFWDLVKVPGVDHTSLPPYDGHTSEIVPSRLIAWF